MEWMTDKRSGHSGTGVPQRPSPPLSSEDVANADAEHRLVALRRGHARVEVHATVVAPPRHTHAQRRFTAIAGDARVDGGVARHVGRDVDQGRSRGDTAVGLLVDLVDLVAEVLSKTALVFLPSTTLSVSPDLMLYSDPPLFLIFQPAPAARLSMRLSSAFTAPLTLSYLVPLTS